MLIVPVAVGLVFVLLYLTFSSARDLLVFPQCFSRIRPNGTPSIRGLHHTLVKLNQMKRRLASHTRNSASLLMLRQLAWCCYHLRRSLYFTEKAARACGLTRIAGYTGRGWATIWELAEFLQERHNSAVELVERAAQRGLIRKEEDARDRRFIRVHQRTLEKLSRRHREEPARIQLQIPTTSSIRPRPIQRRPGA
jgi:hypothetical protein